MEEKGPTRKEFDDLKYIVENHRHLLYDKTKNLDLVTEISIATSGGFSGSSTGGTSPVLSIVQTRYILFKVLDPTTDQTVATKFGGDLESPFTGTIVEIGAFVDTAGTTGTATIDVNKNGNTLMGSTKITLDSTEKSSRTAATAPVLSVTSIAVGDIITVDIDAIHTTPAKGLTVRIGIRET